MLRITEIFGHGVKNCTAAAQADRARRWCPFRNKNCTKSSKTNPIGICSLGNDEETTSICPVRFVEGGRIFTDAAKLAFGAGVSFKVVPEVRILKVGEKKIGKVDYLLAKVGPDNQPCDFAALEVQAVYFSGRTIRPALDYYLKHKKLDPENCERRPDYRSSAQKRLMPQLRLKVPVFRRWGKKFFVVVDRMFFASLPPFRKQTAANSEITWLVYPIGQAGADYKLGSPKPEIVYSESEDVMNALREGVPPEPEEILVELRRRSRNLPLRTT